MGKDECQIGANLRDDNALYYNNAILASVTHFSYIPCKNKRYFGQDKKCNLPIDAHKQSPQNRKMQKNGA